MNKFIVTTTINPPTMATLKFCEIAKEKGWHFIVVGDLKTPDELYQELVKKWGIEYLRPGDQEFLYRKLSTTIGWKTIQRRNIGFVHAYKSGADVIATIDDDNIPYNNWGDDLLIGKEIIIPIYNHKRFKVFDPLSITLNNHLWHRGYPIDYVPDRKETVYFGKEKRKVLIQADLWDGDPDIDSICRLTYKPEVNYNDIKEPYGSHQISPFNSQNTFLAREVIPYYAVLPFVGRMDDIWGGYILQHYFPKSLIYNRASVYQERNKQDLITNLENEIIGYRNTYDLVTDLPNFTKYLPEKTLRFWNTYRNQF